MVEATPPDSGRKLETVTSADGTDIAFERTGSGRPLVLVYGNGDVRDFWELADVRAAFADRCTVYAMERRGRGESGDVAEYALERESEDVAAVVDAIGEPVTLLGHSGGALYSLEAALRTDNLRRLVLYEPPIQIGDHRLDVDAHLAELKALSDRGENERLLVAFLRDLAGLAPEEIDEFRSAPIWRKMVDAAWTLPRELEAIADYEFDSGRFAAVTTPTLLLSGGESPPLYRAATRAVADALPNGRIVTFDGQEHVAMLTATDSFVGEVLAFVRESD